MKMLSFSIEDSSSRNKYEYRVSNDRKTNFPASIGFLVTIPATTGLQLCIILFHFAWVHRWMKWMDCSAGFCRRLSASFCCCILVLVEEVLVLAWSGWGRVESSRAGLGSQAVSWRPVKADLCYSWLRFSMHSAPSEPLILPSIFSGFRTLQPDGMVAPVAPPAYIIYFVLFFICFQSGIAHGFVGGDWDPEWW